MKKLFNILFFISTCIWMTSCEVDNYEEPDATLTGTVIDATTGKGLITEQPNGFLIYYKEIAAEYPSAQFRTFQGKADGTFNNSKLFAATYEVYPGLGAFVVPDVQTVKLSPGSETTVNFTVTPYVSISNVSMTKAGSNALTVQFTLSKNAGTIQDYRIFATNKTPLVGSNITDNVGGGAVALQESDLGMSISVDLSGFETGYKYWVRVGARCNEAPSGRYNMSEVFEIQF